MRVEIVDRDPRVGYTLVRGSLGERWVPDRDRRGWGLQVAYQRWTPDVEVARLRCIKRFQACADCWLHGDLKGMALALAGPPPLVVLEGGRDD
jgi:hypothetical protein